MVAFGIGVMWVIWVVWSGGDGAVIPVGRAVERGS
jgi:hypothetical protein